MLFNSFGYAVFLPVIFLLYWAVPRKWRWVLLFTSSYFFYASWGPEYILVLLLTTLISYYAALQMERAGKQRDKTPDKKKGRKAASSAKIVLVLSVLFCAGLLFFFKYLNFFSENVAALLQRFSIPMQPFTLKLALPIGISFYLFQTISYLADVYKGKIPAERHFGIYAVYISFFPKVMQGPIERGESLLPQLHKPRRFHYGQASYGIKLMAWYPLGHGDKALINEPVFTRLAEKYGKSNVQIILRWHIQSGDIVIPGSKNPAHIKDNFDLFDFSLNPEEMARISAMDRKKRYYTSTPELLKRYAEMVPPVDEQK